MKKEKKLNGRKVKPRTSSKTLSAFKKSKMKVPEDIYNRPHSMMYEDLFRMW
ncbi:MAG: hypothetical protein HYU69_00155 [Bacteroidetes bacterium]|nr:hypothetical protein [Bacteroidota bacterium]